MNKKVIRFDVRLLKNAYVATMWDRAHRDQFLLSPDVNWPLSVDPSVWPSVFYSKIFRDATQLNYGHIEVDPSIDGGEYWLNLEEMKKHYEVNNLPSSDGVFVCIQLHSETSLIGPNVLYKKGDSQFGLSLPDTIPSEVPAGSSLLGYDIADSSWISGLSNCEYSASEKRQLTPAWSQRLNSFGLLDVLDDALKFRHVCDLRVPEHAPFWVFGIFQLPIGRQILTPEP
jgi:hypothetical protein